MQCRRERSARPGENGGAHCSGSSGLSCPYRIKVERQLSIGEACLGDGGQRGQDVRPEGAVADVELCYGYRITNHAPPEIVDNHKPCCEPHDDIHPVDDAYSNYKRFAISCHCL